MIYRRSRFVRRLPLEEVYDRVMLTVCTQESFFDDCNSMTRTSYQQGRKGGVKQVFLYQKDGTLRISGNRGPPTGVQEDLVGLGVAGGHF